MANGGIIGTVNTPTSTTATGVWQQEEQYEAKVTNTWPQRALFTTNSARFDDGSSDSMTRDNGTPSNQKKCTISLWFKRTEPGLNKYLITGYDDENNRTLLQFSSDQLLFQNSTGGSNNTIIKSNAVFRDSSAWYHFCIIVDTTQGTDTNRVKMYVNGSQVTSLASSTYPSADTNMELTDAANSILLNQKGDGSDFNSGYYSEVIVLDGVAASISDFGVANSDGVWTPIPYTGTFGTNGFNLQFQNSAALGTDSSPNGNTFTVSNLTSIDQSTDYPENNFATLNPLENFYNQSTFSEGNLQVAVGSSQYSYNLSTIGVSNGKWYCEIKPTAGSTTNSYAVGITSTQPVSSSQVLGYHPNDVAYRGDGNKKINNSDTSYGNSYTTNDIIGIALNLDDNEVKFYKNGTVQNSGTAISITAPASTGLKNYFFGVSYIDTSNTATFQANFGSPPFAISSGNADGNGYGNFEYAVPSGYYSLNTKNLAEFG